MKGRYSSRKPVDCTASIMSEGLLEKGRILDLSVPGCLLETSLHLKPGQSVQLKLVFSSGKPLGIALAIVRWVSGWKAGVEFIRMSEEDQVRLRWHAGYVENRRTTGSAWSEQVMWTGISEV